MVYTTPEVTGCKVWGRATVWWGTTLGATPYLGPDAGPTADAPGGTNATGTRRVRGHPPPEDLPTLPQYCHPTGQSFLCWNGVLGRCFRGPRCRFARGHIQKGESTDAFADSVTDVISKGVLHFINLPLGEGGAGGSPKNKRKGGGVGAPPADA